MQSVTTAVRTQTMPLRRSSWNLNPRRTQTDILRHGRPTTWGALAGKPPFTQGIFPLSHGRLGGGEEVVLLCRTGCSASGIGPIPCMTLPKAVGYGLAVRASASRIHLHLALIPARKRTASALSLAVQVQVVGVAFIGHVIDGIGDLDDCSGSPCPRLWPPSQILLQLQILLCKG